MNKHNKKDMVQNYIKFNFLSLIWLIAISFIFNDSYGQSWNNIGAPGFSNSYSSRHHLLINNDTLYVAYIDGANKDLIVKKQNGSNWDILGGVVSSSVDYISYGIYNDTSYIAFSDPAASNKLSVKKFNGTTWDLVGSSGISSGSVYSPSIAFKQGNIYVAYNDQTTNLSVKMFDGSSWSTTIENITNWGVGNPDLAFWGNNPTIAYRELENNTYRLVVTSKVGTFWTETTGLPLSAIGDHKIELYNNEAYVAYTDDLAKVNVKKFDGTSWNTIGGGVVSDSVATYLSFAIHNGTPYVSFREMPSLKLRLLKYDGTSWVGLDNAKGYVDNRETYSNSLVIDPSTVYPVIAFADRDNGEKTTVVRFGHTASINETNHYSYEVYPNPVSDYITIKSDGIIKKVVVTNLDGKVVYSENHSNNNIDMRLFKSGVYFVRMETETESEIVKIVKK